MGQERFVESNTGIGVITTLFAGSLIPGCSHLQSLTACSMLAVCKHGGGRAGRSGHGQ